ncbi:MAG: AAA family ATPase [Thermoproteota archaeon]
MVYIKKLEIRGFKSFGRRATLELEKGFTVITGPNGSGKCLANGVKVVTSEGERRIEDLFEDARRTGIEVQVPNLQTYVLPNRSIFVDSFDRAKERIERASVAAIFKQIVEEETYQVETETGRVIRSTGEHRLLVRGATKIWLRARELRAGMFVAALDRKELVWEKISEIKVLRKRRQKVYDLCIPFYHNFIGGAGLVLHNSNVLDAIKFVLGEASAKSLRTDKFAGVVCDSLPTSGPGKTAFVRVVLDNTDRKIPLDEDEVVISREVDSSGESVYRLGRTQTSRMAIGDLLSVAGLSHRGYNMVMQGEIARIADKDPIERRQEIELAVGIADYDERKKQAIEQIKEADTNIRIADARMDEVSKRVSQLEIERNYALRSLFLQREIKKNSAAMISASIVKLREELERKRRFLADAEKRFVETKAQLESKQLEYGEKQEAWKKFTDEMLEKGGGEFSTLQEKAGEVQVRQTEVGAKLASALEGLERFRKDLEVARNNLRQVRKKIRQERRRILRSRADESLLKSNLSRERASLESIRAKIKRTEEIRSKALQIEEEISSEIAERYQELALLLGELGSDRMRARELMRGIRISSERREGLATTLRELAKHLDRLIELRKSQMEMLPSMERNIEEKKDLIGKVSEEIVELTELIERVKGALIQAETRKEIVHTIANEERAVMKIIQLKESSSLDGILGRLSDLIRVKDEDRAAIEAASDGWMRAIVVKDLRTALICAETLKNSKLGRIKIIPLRETEATALEVPNALASKVRRAIDVIEYEPEIEQAVCKVFGDTVLTSMTLDAIEASRQGLRAVTSDGEVFEPSGGIVGGYYRKPIDILTLLPPSQAVERLESNLSKLLGVQQERRKDYAERLRKELNLLSEEKQRTERSLQMIEREAKNIKTEADRIARNLQAITNNIRRDRELLDEIRASVEKKILKRSQLKIQIGYLKQRLNQVRGISYSKNLALLKKKEVQVSRKVAEMEDELNTIRNRITESSRNITNFYEPTAKKLKEEIRQLRIQIWNYASRVRELEKEREELGAQLELLTRKRTDLSRLIEQTREKRKMFEYEIQRLSNELENLNLLLEKYREELSRSRFDVERAELQEKEKVEELRRLGYETTVNFAPELGITEKVLEEMRKEAEGMGPINLLAIDQYAQQYKNFKVLSIRRNELESERAGIVRFMEEIESKKREAFMKALESINKYFGTFFEKITGGKAWLQLENVEDPFSGSLDMYVQFPSKSPRLVSAVSGGEKSVSALSFIFAMQELKPAPFYIMDEVDAHLDPVNAERFAELVRERSAMSQIIVITLRDVVASKAQRVFGAYISNGMTHIVEMPKRKLEA